MIAVPSRHRSLALLGVVLIAQVLLLAVQVRRGGQVRLARVWAVSLITPFQRAGAWVIDGFHDGWNHYISLHNARRENEALAEENKRLRLRNAELEGRAAEADRLAALLHFQEAHPDAPMVAARVISANADAASKTIFINRGERDGIHKNYGVITPDGVVGKVLDVYKGEAQVQLVSDREGGVGALLAASRTMGSVRGTGEPTLEMRYVSNDDGVKAGDAVLTSGQDLIFPKDLPVGTVIEVKSGNPFKQIRVRPAAHLDGLEEVLVLLSRKELETPAASRAAQSGKTP